MSTTPKIRIKDNPDLREEIDKEYETTDQISLSKWAISCAKHVITLIEEPNIEFGEIEKGFEINRLWQKGKATIHDVRQVGFRIHAVARRCKIELTKNAIRSAGQAVGVGHMREHAMVCSDYAIKVIGLAFPNDMKKIKEERTWQLNELKKVNHKL